MPCVASSAAPEGFDNYVIYNKSEVSTSLTSLLSVGKPAWTSPYSMIEGIGSINVAENIFTYGARVNVGTALGDRSSYLLRYDYTMFGLTSFSVKWTHELWRYISTSKDSFGAEYNFFIPIGERDGIYGAFGGYYRYLKQRWNNPWWSPLNYDTKDVEYYFSCELGLQTYLSQWNYFTIDLNTRDTWAYYPLDNFGFDFNLYISTAKDFMWRFNAGTRLSALWSGTAYPNYYYGGIGFVVY